MRANAPCGSGLGHEQMFQVTSVEELYLRFSDSIVLDERGNLRKHARVSHNSQNHCCIPADTSLGKHDPVARQFGEAFFHYVRARDPICHRPFPWKALCIKRKYQLSA